MPIDFIIIISYLRQELPIKIDLKLGIIIVLVGVIGILAGILIGRGSPVQSAQAPAPVSNFVPADDGKLAKEYKEQALVTTIRENAKDLQKCYLAHLETKPKVNEGVLNVLIKVEEDGKVSSASVIKNEFEDAEIADCVAEKLKSYHLPPPPYGINRNIAHVIAFKTEATAEREAKERELKNRPPKVLPVNP